jgi:hypothetical protein
MPVDTRFGVSGLDGLRRSLTRPAYRDATVLVAWEHKQIVTLARKLLAQHGGDPKTAPEWRDDDFDAIYVVTIDRTSQKKAASFKLLHEGIDGLADDCPGVAPARAAGVSH